MTALLFRSSVIAAAFTVMAAAGCHAPGKPAADSETPRPDQVVDFATLYAQNCAACHGANGRNGAAISLANPAYIAIAGAQNIARITAAGVPGTAMPPFARDRGGMLTPQQIQVLAQGIVNTWGGPAQFAGQQLPPYAATQPGDAARGAQAFNTYCARCHHANADVGNDANTAGSITDPTYLALISDQGLRSLILAGMPDQGMPGWRGDTPGSAIPDAHVADIVAWLAQHRTAQLGQPYPQSSMEGNKP